MSATLRLAITMAVAVSVSHSLSAPSPAPAPRDAREMPPPAASASVRAGFYLAADARLRPLDSLDASLYTHLFFSALPGSKGVGAPVVAAAGPKQRGSNVTAGVMSYAELQKIAAAGRGEGGRRRAVVTVTFDNASVASYLSVGDLWVAFDGSAVVAEKLAFAARRGLLGYFLWPVNFDDTNLTLSRSALGVWMKNEISSNSKNGTGGVRQTQGPAVRVPPALQASPAATPGPAQAPASGCGSRSWLPPWTKLDAFLHFGVLILMCF